MQVKTSYNDIWKVAFPVILGGISHTLINITDTIFLGHVGEVELGASAIAGIYYFVLFMIGMGFATGMQILIARKAGEHKEDEIGDIFIHGVYITAVLSVFLFLLLKYFSKSVMNLVISDTKILNAINLFLDFRSWGIFFVLICFLFRSFYIGISETRTITWSMALMAIVNIVLNYLLVFGKYGFPEMGIAGSALSSSIAECCGAGYFIIVSSRSAKIKSMNIFRFGSFSKSLLNRIINLSIPIVLQHILSLGGWLVFFLVIEKTGERNLAVSNIVRSILFVLMTPVWGFFAASNSMTSNIIGQGKSSEVMILIKRIASMSLLLSLIPCVPIFFFPELTIGVFTSNADIVNTSVQSLYMVCGATLVFSVSGILLGAVSGTGSTRQAMVIELITIILYLVYLYLLAFKLHSSIEILWTTEGFYWIVIGLLSFIYLKSNRWEGRKI